MIKYILIILLEVVSFDCNASFLVRLTWIDKTKAFGNEAITFYVDDISSLSKKIQLLDTFSQRQLFECFGLPIITDGYPDAVCSDEKVFSFSEDQLFRNKRVKKISIIQSNLLIRVDFLKADSKYCKFPLRTRYWLELNVLYKEAVLLTAEPLIKKLSSIENDVINSIKCNLERKSSASNNTIH